MRYPTVLKGEQFGRLTILGRVANRVGGSGKHAQWVTLCDCGNYAVVDSGHLRDGQTISCGCLMDERRSAAIRRHGESGWRGHSESVEYAAWGGMITRCENENDSSYPDYGGRGIRIAPEWRHNFEAFLAHVGRRPSEDHTLDRIDPDGDYRPGNVRWATRPEQQRNRRCVRVFDVDGQRIGWQLAADILALERTSFRYLITRALRNG